MAHKGLVHSPIGELELKEVDEGQEAKEADKAEEAKGTPKK